MKNMILILILTLFISSNTLQNAIDKANSGDTLRLSAGIYRGNITISKPLTIIGKESNVIIRGEKKGSVVTIKSSNVHLNNLTITDSGNQIITLDSAIFMDGVSHCSISKCKILNSLYGIDMKMVTDSNISHNYITSNGNELSMRGDALKIWYSQRNSITHNTIDNSRDITLVFSHDTNFTDNRITNGRHALALERSVNSTISNNFMQYNSTGIMLMSSKDTNMSHNQILSCQGAAGIGVMIKGSGNLDFRHNKISYNAKAFYIDTKDVEIGMRRHMTNNIISYNKEAFHFHLAIKNNTITNNKIFANIDDVVKDIEIGSTTDNIISNNYWDTYKGFDKNGDNVGDTPYQAYQYGDWIWHYNHNVKFFYASPAMSLINFLTRLAPFIKPNLLLEDHYPTVNP